MMLPMDEETDDGTEISQEILLERWFNTFRYFEYRKTSRIYSGQGGNSGLGGFVSTILLLLWLISFALQSVVVNEDTRTLTLQFASWSDSEYKPVGSESESAIFVFIGLGLNLIVLVLILIVIIWRLHWQCEITFIIMLTSTIALVVIRGYLQDAQDNNQQDHSLAVAYLSLQFVTAGLIADVVCYYLWSAYLLPSILRWQWSHIIQRKNDKAALIFPFWRLFVFLLFALLVLPLWLLILGSYILVFFLQLIGMPSINRSAFEFLTLYKSAWCFELIKYDVHSDGHTYSHLSADFEAECQELRLGAVSAKDTIEISVRYKLAPWRTAITPFLPNIGATFTFVGQLNSYGVPHGMGSWRDNEPGSGEYLNGRWIDGLPVAPFASREQCQQGGTFAATKIGFVYLSEAAIDRRAPTVAFRDIPLYGVSSTECCISGKFYREYPDASNFLTPIGKSSFSDMWANLVDSRNGLHTQSTYTYSHVNPLVMGENDARRGQFQEEVKDERDTAGRWLDINSTQSEYSAATHTSSSSTATSALPRYDVLVFIPGFNSTLLSSLELIGQMLMLSAMPDSVIPLVFKWPGGNLGSYYLAQEVAQGSELVAHFDDFVENIYATGRCNRIHILGHSMGARAVINILTTSRFSDYGQIILAQPEVDVLEYREKALFMGTHCESQSVYVNSGDWALFGAEVFNRSWNDDNAAEIGSSYSCCPSICSHSHLSLGRASGGPLLDLRGELLHGVDVIDTSSVHSNVHEIRHSFFHLSRETIDDIKQIIVLGQRAEDRKGRLVHRDQRGNIYDVCVAPSFVR